MTALPFPLPLTCPCCWNARRAVRLDPALHCASCGTTFPSVDGIPVLLADSDLRHALSASESPADKRSAFYQSEEGFVRDRPAGHDRLEWALAQCQAPGLVLEIGSANGAFAGTGGADYRALDYSLSMLRSHLQAFGGRRICATAENIPMEAGSCRFVLSVATLEHVPRADLAFEEIDRVLAVGGIAYLAPAWHCRDWAADGLNVRPYRDLDLRQKLRKAAIPLRDSLLTRGMVQLPWRSLRRTLVTLAGGPSRLKFRELAANYEHFWTSDSDACSAIDSHEGILFFESRGYVILAPRPTLLRRLFFRSGAIIALKTASGAHP